MNKRDLIKKKCIKFGHFVIHERDNAHYEATTGLREESSHFFIPLYQVPKNSSELLEGLCKYMTSENLPIQVEAPSADHYNYTGVKGHLEALCQRFLFSYIQLDCEDITMARFFLDQVYPYMQSYLSILILSQKNIDFFKNENHPCFLLRNGMAVIDEATGISKKEAFDRSKESVKKRLVSIGQSDNFSLIERKIHLYLLGMQIERNDRFIPDLYELNYPKIAMIFEQSLGIKKKLIVKAIDRLRKKRVIEVESTQGTFMFSVSNQGPMDLVATHPS